jgi:transketolase
VRNAQRFASLMLSDKSQLLAKSVRVDALKMVHGALAAHIGSALSIADIVAVLYTDILRINPKIPKQNDRDRFILSKGHACVAVYAALADKGFFPKAYLSDYGSENSILMNHISHKVAGVEFSTGSLGHGLPFGTGKALAAKKQGGDWRVFVLMSDGELDSGANWEAFMFAAHHQLDNLIAVIDYNKQQSLTTVAQTLGIEPLAAKLQAFGWSVQEVDGHDHLAINTALTKAPWSTGKPSVLVAHTVKGRGVSFMENKVEWHYKSPNAAELKLALAELSKIE